MIPQYHPSTFSIS